MADGARRGDRAAQQLRGPLWRPTITAPGMFIASVRARTGFYADVADATGANPAEPILPPDDLSYAYASGTSMSAPHISGVVALMQEAAIRRLNRYLTPAEIRNVLQNTAARGPAGLPNYQGYTMGAGLADALAAVRAVVSASEAVTGTWSAVYPDGTMPPPAQTAAGVTVTGPATPNPTGQTAALTATIKDAAGHPVANAPVAWSSGGVGSVAAGETITDARGIALASARSDSPGTQTVTASSGSASGSVTLTWIGLPQPPVPPPTPSTPGKASGGGHFNDPAKRTFGFYAEYTESATASGGDLSYDDKLGTKVQATGISSLVVSGNQATVDGSASVNGAGSYRFTLEVVDNGAPGRSDTFHLVVTDPADPAYRYETQGTLAGGNIQVTAY